MTAARLTSEVSRQAGNAAAAAATAASTSAAVGEVDRAGDLAGRRVVDVTGRWPADPVHGLPPIQCVQCLFALVIARLASGRPEEFPRRKSALLLHHRQVTNRKIAQDPFLTIRKQGCHAADCRRRARARRGPARVAAGPDRRRTARRTGPLGARDRAGRGRGTCCAAASWCSRPASRCRPTRPG